ncbi:MAG: DUF488 family protein [Planctomycetota bacterium]
MPTVQLRRIYDEPSPDDGHRVLIDGLWPRGIRKDAGTFDEWARELAPTAELRKWFSHTPERFAEFERRFRAELAQRDEAQATLLRLAQEPALTLLFAARDEEHNHAVVLARVLDEMR